MKTIEERVVDAGILSQYMAEYPYDKRSVELGYMAGAYDQKAIDDAEWLKIKSSWEKQAQINHDDEANYKQGYHDAIEKACEACKNELRRLKTLLDEIAGVPSNLISVGKSLSAIRREMEESL